MAVIAMVALSACDGIQFGGKEDETIKVYRQDTGTEMADGESVLMEEIMERYMDSVVFVGYVANVSDRELTLQMKVECEDSNFRYVIRREDGVQLPADSVYTISDGMVAPGVIVAFSTTSMFSVLDTTLKGDTKVTYTFYAKEFPSKTVKIDVIYKYELHKVKHGIKVYQGYLNEGVELANDTSIVVDRVVAGDVYFDGYAENIDDDFVHMKVRVEMKSEGAGQVFCQGDGTALPMNSVYSLSRETAPGDIAGFSAYCCPQDRTVAGDYEAVYTFYTEEYPEDTVAVNVTFRYVPEKQ